MRKIFIMTAFVLALSTPAFADSLFSDLTFDAAKTRAAEEKKFIFIDFFATWCGPCKMLDKSTFTDEKVAQWLKTKSVPIKVDSDQNKDLAKQYKVSALPTLLLLNADGTEKGRMVGFQSADDFVTEGEAILAGKDSITRAREAAERRNLPELRTRMRLADTMARGGRHEEALAEYLWCYDQGGKDPSFAGVRHSFLLSSIARLGAVYPKALEELKIRRDQFRKIALENPGDKEAIVGLSSFNRALAEPDDTLAVWNEIKDREDLPPSAGSAFFPACFPLLLEEKQYERILAEFDLDHQVETAFGVYDNRKDFDKEKKLAELPEKEREKAKAMMDKLSEDDLARINKGEDIRLYNTIVPIYQVYVGVGREEDARHTAERLLGQLPNPDIYNFLAWNGYLTGNPGEGDREMAQKSCELSKWEDIDAIDTLARILHLQGKQEQALKAANKGREKADDEREKKVIEELLAWLVQPVEKEATE